MKNLISLIVDTKYGSGILENIYITELGLVMGKVFYPKVKIYKNYRISDIENNISIKYKIDKNK